LQPIDPRSGIESNCQRELEGAIRVLKADGVVAFPTDTLYGLGATVFSEQALGRVFQIKGRPMAMALPVLVADWEQVSLVASQVPQMGRHLAQRDL
jgi:L-threonylcarbamoyladenylate synthase